MEDSLLEKLGRDSVLHARGEFTLELGKAAKKLARFQLEDPRDFLFQLVAGLFRVGARSVEVEVEKATLRIRLAPLVVPERFPDEFELEVFEADSPWRRLAAATQALLALEPEQLLWVGKGKGQQWNLLDGTGEGWKKPEVCEILAAKGGLDRRLLEGALSRLRERAAYCRRLLKIQGKALEPVQIQTHVGRWLGTSQIVPGQSARLNLVVDEMTTPPRPLDLGLGWSGFVYWDEPTARLDASLGSVVEDATLHELVRQIPSTFPGCLLEHLGDPPLDPNSRRIVLDHLHPPLTPWAQTIEGQLKNCSLFVDQRGRYWSLASLQDYAGRIYHSPFPLAFEVDDLVLMEGDPWALQVLHIYLGDRLQETTRAVLLQLRRDANKRKWSMRPEQPLQLPPQSWLYQAREANWILGISTHWLLPGGTVHFFHQRRLLCDRHLSDVAITFTVVSDVEEADIDELWEDVREEYFERNAEAWRNRCRQLLQDQADPPGPLAEQMLRALAREIDPRESFFYRSRLFRDREGQSHSLEGLYTRQQVGGTVAFISGRLPLPEDPDLLPKALVLKVPSQEGRKLLEQAPGLGARNFDVFLEDLQQAREYAQKLPNPSDRALHWLAPEYRAWLEVLPHGLGGKVELVTRGITVEPEVFPSPLAFRARVYGDQFKLDIRTANFNRGIERYVPASRAAWKHCLDDLQSRLGEALAKALEALQEQETSWPRGLLVEGLGQDYPILLQCRCLASNQGNLSLDFLLRQPEIAWTSNPLSEATEWDPSRTLLSLKTSEQQKLEQLYGGKWSCLDQELAHSAALRAFLQRPRHVLDPLALQTRPLEPPLTGQIVALSRPQSSLVLLHRERWVGEQSFPLPGLSIYLECPPDWMTPDLKSVRPPSSSLEEAHRQARLFLVEWMRSPRLYLKLQHWQSLEEAGPQVAECLLHQPWFPTNRGPMCWHELMAQPKLGLASSNRPGHDASEAPVVAYAADLPQALKERLREQHLGLMSEEETEAWFNERERRQKQRAELEKLVENWKHLEPRRTLEQPFPGLILWNPGSQKDFWRVHAGVRSPESRLPACLSGYVEVEDGREPTPEKLADLLEQALPLLEARLQQGPLEDPELQSVSEYCLVALPLDRAERLRELRWIPCHDGCFTSLQQLRLQGQEQGAVDYWTRNYPGRSSSLPIPLLPNVLMQEMVKICCEVEVRLHPAPWLYRSVGEVIREAGSWLRRRPGERILQALQALWGGQPVGEESRQLGQTLLQDVERSAQLLLIDPLARQETLPLIQQATFAESKRLWKCDSRGKLTLNPDFPPLQQARPEQRALCLLLGIVSLSNTRSQPFSDEMEEDFLHRFVDEIVGAHRGQSKH